MSPYEVVTILIAIYTVIKGADEFVQLCGRLQGYYQKLSQPTLRRLLPAYSETERTKQALRILSRNRFKGQVFLPSQPISQRIEMKSLKLRPLPPGLEQELFNRFKDKTQFTHKRKQEELILAA